MADGPKPEQGKVVLDYALKYFEIHAAQRMSVFNFFIVLSSIVLTGLATCVVGERVYAPIGIPLGLLLTALGLTFWKLDQRTSFLVKRAEATLETVEQNHFPEFARIITNEPGEFERLNKSLPWYRKRWTYSRSLGLVFLVVATMGVIGTALSTSRIAGVVSWFDKDREAAKPDMNVVVLETARLKLARALTGVDRAHQKEKKPRDRSAQTPD